MTIAAQMAPRAVHRSTALHDLKGGQWASAIEQSNQLPVVSRPHGSQRIHANARVGAGPRLRWLCRQRRDYPPDADVRHLRFHWHDERTRLEAELRTGCFRFGPLSVITNADGEVLHPWSARDALV